ncbi:RNA polymerase sigma factor [Nonomuraea sp. NPDC050790]|uniref:RNA polymerase sigma factor n=1 Tax=Nonomuraea sp. NPDC050790 TaxID=3364371 RepID=UPI0037B41847
MLNGDDAAALFDAYRPRVYAYAVSRCGRRLTEDVISETFVVVWRRRDVTPAKPPLPWLLGVAHNVIRELRQAALDERSPVHQVTDTGSRPGPRPAGGPRRRSPCSPNAACPPSRRPGVPASRQEE